MTFSVSGNRLPVQSTGLSVSNSDSRKLFSTGSRSYESKLKVWLGLPPAKVVKGYIPHFPWLLG